MPCDINDVIIIYRHFEAFYWPTAMMCGGAVVTVYNIDHNILYRMIGTRTISRRNNVYDNYSREYNVIFLKRFSAAI